MADDVPSSCAGEAAIHELSLVLDGVRDVMATVNDCIEYSQATISSYQEAYVEEKHGVRILAREPSPASSGSMASVETDFQAKSAPFAEGSGLAEPVAETMRRPLAVPRSKGKRRQDRGAKRPSRSRPFRDVSSRAAATHALIASDIHTDSSPISSAGLTNTSDEDID